MGYKGFDTTDALPDLTGAGFDFVIKYCADSGTFPNKRFTHEEAAAIHALGMKVGFVYERGNGPDYFTAEQGAADASATLAYFSLLGVDKPTCCFYAVDLDIDPANIEGYASVFHHGMTAGGHLSGVYGPGAVCKAMKDAGFCHYTWLANASGWTGYQDFLGQQEVLQELGSVLGLSSDPDTATTLDPFW